jgi:hypothetical protein
MHTHTYTHTYTHIRIYIHTHANAQITYQNWFQTKTKLIPRHTRAHATQPHKPLQMRARHTHANTQKHITLRLKVCIKQNMHKTYIHAQRDQTLILFMHTYIPSDLFSMVCFAWYKYTYTHTHTHRYKKSYYAYKVYILTHWDICTDICTCCVCV